MTLAPSSDDFECLLEQASEWLVKMTSDTCTEQDQLAFKQWQQQSPQHQAAAQRIQTMIDRLQQLQQPQDHSVTRTIIENALTEQPKFKFKPDMPILILACCSIFVILMAGYLLPLNYWTAENTNKYNSWRNETLIDQSEIRISGHSAYNLHFDQKQRVVELLQGNILVDVAKDAKRPFIIQTENGSIKALGTKFMVHKTDRYTILTMLESKVEVKTKSNTAIVVAGQQAVIDQLGSIVLKPISTRIMETAWYKHSLAVEEMPLDQVLEILDSYQQGKLYYNKDQIKQLKVTAILPLNEENKAFYLLQDSLPIRVSHPIPYVVTISKK